MPRISRRPEILAAIDRLVSVDEEIAGRVVDLRRDEQAWGSAGLHYTGTWRATGAPVLLKLNVGADELFWVRWLAAHAPDLVPVLYASGERLGTQPALPLRWTISERVAYSMLGPDWEGHEFDMLLEAGVRFALAARSAPAGHAGLVTEETVRGWLARGLAANPPGPAARLLDRLAEDWAWVIAVCPPERSHGDLHMCNVVTRTPPPVPSCALLIDPAPAVQPWAFDAARAQVLNSIDRQRVGYRGLVPRMAALRRAHGLPVPDGSALPRLAALTLGWYAVAFWAATPARQAIPDYAAETQRYIEESLWVNGGLQI